MDRKWAGVPYKKKTGRRVFFAIDERVIPPRSVTPLSVQTMRSTLRFVSDIEPPTQTRKVITSYQCNIVTSCCSGVILPHNKNPDKHFVKSRFAFKIGKCSQCTMHSNPFKFMETNMKSRLFDKQYPTVEGNINNVAQEDEQILLETVYAICVHL